MYDLAKKARAGMKSKAERLAGEKDRKTDSSDWSPAEPLNADVKTGMRPVSRRAYKNGGKVADCAPMRADRKPRKGGGKVEEKGEQPLVDRYINRDLKKANEYRDGKKHVGALKHGGRAHKADGGSDGKSVGWGTGRAGPREKQFDEWMRNKDLGDASKMGIGERLAKGAKVAGKALIEPYGRQTARIADSLGMKKGGRAAKASGGSMTMEEMIKKNPAPAKPTFRDKSGNIPLPPRRPADVTPAATNRIKPDEGKRLTGDYISPQEIGRKYGGRAKKQDGGRANLDKMLAKQKEIEADRKEYADKMNKKYPGKSWIERVQAEMNEKFSPEYFAGLKESRKKELSENKGYQEFAKRQAKKSDDDSDDKMKKGGRVAKADGGSMDPRLGIVKPKAMEFGQNLVTPGLKKGGRIAKQIGGGLGISANRMMPQLPPQAMASAQGVPMQGGSFMPPGLANRPAMPTLPPQAMGAAPAMPTLPAQAAPQAMSALNAARPFARKRGGPVKGKTNINIIIAAGKKEPESMIPSPNQALMGVSPIPGANAPAPAPMGMPPMPAAPMGGGQPPMPPIPRKAGGRVSKIAKSAADMTAGAGSGEGRLQKTDIAKRAPHKRGGKVYRSYKDMDAGAGSGEGRLEKTEIQKRKK